MSATIQRITARLQATKVQASHSWAAIAQDFYNISAMMDALVRMEIRSARDAGELPKGKTGVSSRATQMAWQALERKLFKSWDSIVEFNKSLDAKKSAESLRSNGALTPYFTTDAWIKDVGPIGKKVRDIVEEAVWDSL